MASHQQDDVALVRASYEAFNERNLDTVAETFAEDVEFVEPEGWRYGGTYHSPDAVAA